MAVVDPTTLWRRCSVGGAVEQFSLKTNCLEHRVGAWYLRILMIKRVCLNHTKLECDLLCLRFKTCIFQGKMVQLDRIRIDIAKLHPQSRRSYSCFNRFTVVILSGYEFSSVSSTQCTLQLTTACRHINMFLHPFISYPVLVFTNRRVYPLFFVYHSE